MKNQVSSTGEGRHLTITKASVRSGDLVWLGTDGLHGVAFIDTDGNGQTVIDTAGVFALPVESGKSFSVGDAVYQSSNTGYVTPESTTGLFVGWALTEITSAKSGETIHVFLGQAPPVPGS